MELENTIAQLNYLPVSWHRFLQKACDGSYKAVEMLTAHAMALAVHLAGPDIIDTAPLAQYERVLVSRLPERFPFPHPQACADYLTHVGIAPSLLIIQTTPLHPYTAYESLWKRKRSESVNALLHDAILVCANDWRAVNLITRLDVIEQKQLDYNALDVVSCMLMLVMAWPGGQQNVLS